MKLPLLLLLLLYLKRPAAIKLCDPLLPDDIKRMALAGYRKNDSIPLVMWRIMKSGTSTACQLMIDEYRKVRGYQKVLYHGMCGGPIHLLASEPPTTWEVEHDKGVRFIGMEAAVLPPFFPKEYHEFAHGFLDPTSSDAATRRRVWEHMVHMLIFRHPLERAISAFNFKHHAQHNVTGLCNRKGVHSLLDCLRKCIEACEGDPAANAFLRDAAQPYVLTMVKTQVCGNFVVSHLSHNDSLDVARQNLRRFSLIVDLISLPTESATLIKCVLGWQLPRGIPRTNANHDPHLLNLPDIPEDLTVRLQRLMEGDLLLYDDALSLIAAHHKQALLEVL